MQHEFAMAAAYASGGLQEVSHGGIPQHMSQPFVTGPPVYEQDMYDVSYSELPSVDDLEVAAAAAAAAMDPDNVTSSDDTDNSSENDEDDSSEESTSSGYQSSTDDQMHSSMQLIRLELVVSGDQVTAQIVPQDDEAAEPLAVPEEPDSDTSSESDTEQISDIREMREIIARMDDDDDGGDHDKDEAAAQMVPVEPLDIEIGESEVLLPAGTISSMLEGTIVVQVAENGRALTEGTVLCSEDRIPIGRIEDVFGPVMCPLYTLRWAGQGDMPPSVVLEGPLYTTQKLAEYLLPEQLYTEAGNIVDDDLEEEELEFSDDEKEAEYKRKLKAKRKQRDGLEADLGAGRGGARSAVRGRARRGHMDSPGPAGSWRGGRMGGRGAHADPFNAMHATGQMAGMQINSPGLAAHSPMAPPAHSEPYTQQPSAGFQAGYAEGLRLAQQQLAQQHLQPIPPQHQPLPPQQQGYQQYWHPHQAPVPGYYNPAPAYNSSIMPASPAMNPSAAWQQHGQPQQVPNQAATFFRGRGRGRRGGGRS